jgi:cysteinyl-tRNA synthetase
MLTLYNTLSGKQEEFKPLTPKQVRMYVCGVTVYDYSHIGHARSALVFDVLRRYLEYSGYEVTFVKNFTDVDDKIIKRANEQHVSYEVLTSRYIDAYYEDMGKLGIKSASIEPKATEHMTQIIGLTDRLVKKGLAYIIDGDVYFQVEKYRDYGRLSKRKVDELQAGARVEVDERKRHPMDFALWKRSKPGEPSWPSPWGTGRPGWHIECSAMSIKYLGETFDIHGGGMDLIFPHHENEIAQSCGATGKEFANYWIHNGFVQINHEKMSKSLGNFFTIREIFEKSKWSERVTGEVLRYFLISTHYHGPLDFSDQALQEAKQTLDGFYGLLNRLRETERHSAGDKDLTTLLSRAQGSFRKVMDNDLNTPMAIAELQKLRSDLNKLLEMGLSTEGRQQALEEFRRLGDVLGLFQLDTWDYGMMAASGTDELHAEAIEAKLSERNEARKRKDFAKADEIRKSLAAKGIIIEDKPDGTSRWKR